MKKAVITLMAAAFLISFSACKDTKKAEEEAEVEMIRQIDSLEQELDTLNEELDALLKEMEEIEIN